MRRAAARRSSSRAKTWRWRWRRWSSVLLKLDAQDLIQLDATRATCCLSCLREELRTGCWAWGWTRRSWADEEELGVRADAEELVGVRAGVEELVGVGADAEELGLRAQC